MQSSYNSVIQVTFVFHCFRYVGVILMNSCFVDPKVMTNVLLMSNSNCSFLSVMYSCEVSFELFAFSNCSYSHI